MKKEQSSLYSITIYVDIQTACVALAEWNLFQLKDKLLDWKATDGPWNPRFSYLTKSENRGFDGLSGERGKGHRPFLLRMFQNAVNINTELLFC